MVDLLRSGRRAPQEGARPGSVPWRRGCSVPSLAPLRARVIAARPRDHVFETFVHRTGAWWPVDGQCARPERVAEVRWDPWVGGQLAEVWHDGSEHPFATVLRWRPPREIGLVWRVRPGVELTDVTVRFAEASWVSAWVSVEHTGWAGLGADGSALRMEYRERWADVLGALLWAL